MQKQYTIQIMHNKHTDTIPCRSFPTQELLKRTGRCKSAIILFHKQQCNATKIFC